VAAAVKLLEESLAEWRGTRVHEGNGEETADDPAVARSAVLAVLRLLGRFESDAAVSNGIRILRTDPAATKTYVLSYLRRLPTDEIDIAGHVEQIVEAIGLHAPAWQQAWLMDALLDTDLTLTPSLAEWLKDFVQGRHPATLRVRALLVLGLHDVIEPSEISRHFDAVPSVARPDVAAALAARVADTDDAALKPVRRGGKIYTWIIDDVIGALPDVSML
jgi:hypothetical protein